MDLDFLGAVPSRHDQDIKRRPICKTAVGDDLQPVARADDRPGLGDGPDAERLFAAWKLRN